MSVSDVVFRVPKRNTVENVSLCPALENGTQSLSAAAHITGICPGYLVQSRASQVLPESILRPRQQSLA